MPISNCETKTDASRPTQDIPFFMADNKELSSSVLGEPQQLLASWLARVQSENGTNRHACVRSFGR